MKIMKNLFIIVFAATFYNCTAQIHTVSLENKGECQSGYYHKDINNTLDPFVGTWIYTNGATELTFILKKIVNNNNGYCTEDLLVGEYRYIENNVTLINTLFSIDATYLPENIYDHAIAGNTVLDYQRWPPCNDCEIEEKRLRLRISDNIKDVAALLVLRRIIVGGQPAITALIQFDGIRQIDDINVEFVGSTVPNGNYVLIKQP